MADILDKIIAYKKDEVIAQKKTRSEEALRDDIAAAGPTRPFIGALSSKIKAGSPALIAEIKKASPSKGLIREDFAPAELAKAYEKGGAACLSVLTDTPSFQGHPDYLKQARASCHLPVLRKDFMIDPYQVLQARSWGADCILLIMACTNDGLAGELVEAAHDLDMAVLVEVHNEAELQRALPLDCRLIGINNRNLKTFETRLDTSEKLAALIPNDRIIISESGIYSHDDLKRLSCRQINAFLVGESLMRQENVEQATRNLLGCETVSS